MWKLLILSTSLIWELGLLLYPDMFCNLNHAGMLKALSDGFKYVLQKFIEITESGSGPDAASGLLQARNLRQNVHSFFFFLLSYIYHERIKIDEQVIKPNNVCNQLFLRSCY